jgi:hypothetical protein
MARERATLWVLAARDDLRVDYFDAAGWLIKWRKITSEGLLHTRPGANGPLERGPVHVPSTPYYRQQIRQGALIVAPTPKE